MGLKGSRAPVGAGLFVSGSNTEPSSSQPMWLKRHTACDTMAAGLRIFRASSGYMGLRIRFSCRITLLLLRSECKWHAISRDPFARRYVES